MRRTWPTFRSQREPSRVSSAQDLITSRSNPLAFARQLQTVSFAEPKMCFRAELKLHCSLGGSDVCKPDSICEWLLDFMKLRLSNRMNHLRQSSSITSRLPLMAANSDANKFQKIIASRSNYRKCNNRALRESKRVVIAANTHAETRNHVMFLCFPRRNWIPMLQRISTLW